VRDATDTFVSLFLPRHACSHIDRIKQSAFINLLESNPLFWDVMVVAIGIIQTGK
jgi:hypothetical protein